MQTKEKSSRDRKKKSKKDIRELDVDETNLLVEHLLKEGSWTRLYRSSLHSIIDFFKGVELRKEHLDCLRRTHVYHFILPCALKKISLNQVTSTRNGVSKLLMLYNKEKKCIHNWG